MKPVNDVKRQLKALQHEESTLKKFILEQEEKLRDVQQKIREIKGNDNINWSQGAVECITEAKEMVTTDEILDYIFAQSLYHGNRNSYRASLSQALHKLLNAGQLIRVRPKAFKGYFYGLPEWIDENGDLRRRYRKQVELKSATSLSNETA